MKTNEVEPKLGWTAAAEKSLRITYWVTKIALAVAWAKEKGLLDWIG